ncbi:hypothetical protein [Aureimonas sp. SK2]|uniref:hypothetical protein n=1 Tax=Aureimonas sp. SK2 TaxID=3015992 RepID=UPI0024451A16|nr:hypothetical protein [Aureimonas sp. SK2]
MKSPKLRNYYISVVLHSDDFEKHGNLDVDAFEALHGAFAVQLKDVRDDLIERRIQTATIRVFDYADDAEGEEVHEEDFDLADHDVPDIDEEEAQAALSRRDADLVIVGEDPAHDWDWRVGRKLKDGGVFLMGLWFPTLRELAEWAEKPNHDDLD